MKKLLPTLISLFFSISFLTTNAQEKAEDFTLTDINGETHSLYADYLDQGKTVLISFGAAWNVWDSVWIGSGVLQDFHVQYGGDSDAAVLFVAPLGPTVDDLYGLSEDTYDLVTGNDYPIFSTPIQDSIFLDLYEVVAFPTIRMICPDGTMYTDIRSNRFIEDTLLFYSNFIDNGADAIAERMNANCGTLFSGNSLSGTVFNDDKDDCLRENDDALIPHVKARITGSNGSYNRITNNDGNFYSIMKEDDYTVEIIPPNTLWEACNSPQSFTYPDDDTQYSADFGLQALVNCYSPTVSISSPLIRRCFESDIFISYCNEGTEPAPGAYVFLQLDPSLEFLDADANYTVENDGILFVLGDLDIWECGTIKVKVYVDCDDTMLGDEVCYSAKISPHVCNADSLFYDYECQEIVGAYDPNDKRAFPNYGLDEYNFEPVENLKYQIRFQNTGTDTAFNVVIEDLISPYLNLETLRAGASSHAYDLEIIDERKVKFIFSNIMLPDSNVNLAGSNGFITYYIDPKSNLPNDVRIENRAGIFFDFNEAVITNTTVHTFNNTLGTGNINDDLLSFNLIPNPAKNDLQLILKDSNFDDRGTIEIFDITGRLQLEKTIIGHLNHINVSALNEGVYIIKVNAYKGLSMSKKLIVER